MSDGEPLPPSPSEPARARYPGEIWETHTGGLEVIVSSQLYNESRFATVVTCALSSPPGHFRPFVVPATADHVVYVDRISMIPAAWLIQLRGTLAPAALADVDRHLATLFMR